MGLNPARLLLVAVGGWQLTGIINPACSLQLPPPPPRAVPRMGLAVTAGMGWNLKGTCSCAGPGWWARSGRTCAWGIEGTWGIKGMGLPSAAGQAGSSSCGRTGGSAAGWSRVCWGGGEHAGGGCVPAGSGCLGAANAVAPAPASAAQTDRGLPAPCCLVNCHKQRAAQSCLMQSNLSSLKVPVC